MTLKSCVLSVSRVSQFCILTFATPTRGDYKNVSRRKSANPKRFLESAMMKTKTIVKVSTISIDIEASRNNTNTPQSAGTVNIVIKTKVK